VNVGINRGPFRVDRRHFLVASRTVLLAKMCVNSCIVTTAYVFLLVAVLACALSYVAPFWILFPSSITGAAQGFAGDLAQTYGAGIIDTRIIGIAGLWASCDTKNENCVWFWEDDFDVEKNQPGGCCRPPVKCGCADADVSGVKCGETVMLFNACNTRKLHQRNRH